MNILKLNTVQNAYEMVVDEVFATHYTSVDRRVLSSIGGPENQLTQKRGNKKQARQAMRVNVTLRCLRINHCCSKRAASVIC
jgi:hypothetical protein